MTPHANSLKVLNDRLQNLSGAVRYDSMKRGEYGIAAMALGGDRNAIDDGRDVCAKLHHALVWGGSHHHSLDRLVGADGPVEPSGHLAKLVDRGVRFVV